MDFKEIIYEKSEGVATITLNRPERMNAFTDVMLREWAQALEDARLDREIRAVVLTGAGRGFCAGADLRGGTVLGQGSGSAAPGATPAGPPSAADRRNWLRDGVHYVPRAVQLLDKPYIAAVNGAAVGAGMDMASMADIRIVSEHAKFAMSYVKVGLVPGDGGCYLLPRIVGVAKALELIWTGDFVDADEAVRIGYASRVVAADELMDVTRDFALRLAKGPAVAMQLAKRLVYRGLTADWQEAFEQAGTAMAIAQTTEDAREGPRAFVENRPPNFQGR
ncbi:MAG TPA: enoyl-CoA hydratase-related protein [Dehalococcoidia bacterium]|nr:enoyl-CoA hydratase-related protein [Dehalococcoidia bacterium]